MFIDKAVIRVKAGDGGNGAVSFHREKFVAAGGPDGGDGGKGGDIVLVGSADKNALIDFKYKKNFIAENGQKGGPKRCSGKGGQDLVIKVPMGTIVRDGESGQIMADISGEEPVIIAKGGNGGWGNSHFATPTRQIPRFAKPGIPGEKFDLQLELKLLAGVVKVAEGKSFVMADIPGLIEGASEGIGLGHEFLRHVERCRLIVHVVDVSGSEGRDPKEDFETINRELANFNAELAAQEQIVVGNKADMASDEQVEEFRRYIEEKGLRFFRLSAATHQGVEALVQEIAEKLDRLPPIKRFEADYVPKTVDLSGADKWKFDIKVEDGVYIVEADWLVKVFGMISLDDEEDLGYFQRILRSSGIIDRLEEMGIQEGDTVSILNFEFDYIR